MATFEVFEIVSFVDTDNGCMAETEIQVCGQAVGYVGGSRHVEITRQDAESAVRDVLLDLLSLRIAAHPEVDARSRFDYDDWD